MNYKILIGLSLATLVVGFLIGYEIGKGKTPEPVTVTLPLKVVPVTVVKTIKVPGPFRVVDHVKLQTTVVEVPVEKIREVATFIDPLGRVRIEANKFEGLKNGKPAFGWKGNAICEFAPKDKPVTWTKLVESPFDLTESRAETITPPGIITQRKTRLDLALGVSGSNALAQLGLSRRFTHKGFLGRTFAPDWCGASIGYSPSGRVQVLASVSKEF